MTLKRASNLEGTMMGLFQRLAAVSLSSVLIAMPTEADQNKQAGSLLQAGSIWIGKAQIPTDNSNKTFREQGIAMRVEYRGRSMGTESYRATIWPTQGLLLDVEGNLTKENNLTLSVVEVRLPKDDRLDGVPWQKGITFEGRQTGDKIEGIIRWPPRKDGLEPQGKFMLRLVK